jgi:3-hydroxy-9,10-secoandrosta-1,3,5(10)-triene-9,17-dione monooxygenase reductase component
VPPGGSSVHYGDPWADPEGSRDPVRRLRGRLPGGVTVWTAGDASATQTTGITVSSLVMAQGDPPTLAGLVGPDTDFAEALEGSGVFVVHVLGDDHRRIGQHFAGMLPAPPELLRVEPSPHGPVLAAVPDRIYCRSVSTEPFGWSLLVQAVVDGTEIGPPRPGLAWYRGDFSRLTRS